MTARTAVRFARPTLPPLREVKTVQPGWELKFQSGGVPFNVFVRARNTQAADAEGRIELATQFPDFDPDTARLVQAVETR